MNEEEIEFKKYWMRRDAIEHFKKVNQFNAVSYECVDVWSKKIVYYYYGKPIN